MAVRFNNNNNSEWMEEMQILFDKINNGSPFGVTFIRPISSKQEIFLGKNSDLQKLKLKFQTPRLFWILF
ncbi:hypothetical protein C2R64_06735 [Helicobacter pylori]|nr:hypothetical protein C2R64_06735 [Helicobacter pylori]